jgi:hypothetical protein
MRLIEIYRCALTLAAESYRDSARTRHFTGDYYDNYEIFRSYG